MKTIKILQKELLSQLSNKIVEYGFDKKIRGQSFFKPINDGRAVLHFSFIDHKDEFDVTIDVAIRFNALENLINKENRLLSKKEKDETCSLGVELGNLSQGKPRRWSIKNQVDIDSAVKEMTLFIKEIGLPYISEYSDLKQALSILSKDTPGAWIHAPIHGERAKRAVGLAFLLNESEKLKSLINSKSAFLAERKDFGLASFNIFISHLKKDK